MSFEIFILSILILLIIFIIINYYINYKQISTLKAELNIVNINYDTLIESINKENKILIKYHDKELIKLAPFSNGDMIDLRADEDYDLKAGDFKLINLGVSMKLPAGYYAILVPRSSTFKRYGIIQTNSVGIIDNSYSGDDDIWMMPIYATKDTHIKKNDRICQFTIIQKEFITFKETDHLSSKNRGGFGSTGRT